MKTSVAKKDAIMLDDHNEVKRLLLEWLVMFGRREVSVNELVNSELDAHRFSLWWLIEQGLLHENTKTDVYHYSLTDKGVKYVGQRS